MTIEAHSTPRADAGRKLPPMHARTICAAVRPMLGYVGRLRERMYATGWTDADKLMQMVNGAQDALHRLTVELHYEGCEREDGR